MLPLWKLCNYCWLLNYLLLFNWKLNVTLRIPLYKELIFRQYVILVFPFLAVFFQVAVLAVCFFILFLGGFVCMNSCFVISCLAFKKVLWPFLMLHYWYPVNTLNVTWLKWRESLFLFLIPWLTSGNLFFQLFLNVADFSETWIHVSIQTKKPSTSSRLVLTLSVFLISTIPGLLFSVHLERWCQNFIWTGVQILSLHWLPFKLASNPSCHRLKVFHKSAQLAVINMA